MLLTELRLSFWWNCYGYFSFSYHIESTVSKSLLCNANGRLKGVMSFLISEREHQCLGPVSPVISACQSNSQDICWPLHLWYYGFNGVIQWQRQKPRVHKLRLWLPSVGKLRRSVTGRCLGNILHQIYKKKIKKLRIWWIKPCQYSETNNGTVGMRRHFQMSHNLIQFQISTKLRKEWSLSIFFLQDFFK